VVVVQQERLMVELVQPVLLVLLLNLVQAVAVVVDKVQAQAVQVRLAVLRVAVVEAVVVEHQQEVLVERVLAAK
jgi:hypothetical protein